MNRECTEGNVTVGAVRLDEPQHNLPEVQLLVFNGALTTITLESCYLLFEHHGFAIEGGHKRELKLKTTETCLVKLRVVADQLGVRRDWCVFEFKNPDGVEFSIIRFLSVHFTDSVTCDPSLQGAKRYVPKPVKLLQPNEDDVIDGEKPDK